MEDEGKKKRGLSKAEVETTALKKIHWAIGIAIAIMIPTISGVASYFSALSAIDQKITDTQINQANNFVKKDDFKEANQRLIEVQNGVSRIEGYLRINMNRR